MMPNFETNIDNFNFLGPVSLQKETTATTKEGPIFLVEVQAKLYYGLKTMERKFRKYVQVENIVVYLENTSTCNVKYENEEDRVKALIGLIHEERVVATEERKGNVSKSVSIEHCFKKEGKQEITKKRKTPR